MSWYEKEARKALEAEGYIVVRGGEPDFWLVKDGKIVGWREVKGLKDKVRPIQQKMHDLLEASGIPGEVIRFKSHGSPSLRKAFPANYSKPVVKDYGTLPDKNFFKDGIFNPAERHSDTREARLQRYLRSRP